MNSNWLATAPSNIALIKYMGKSDATVNRPTNTSLSYTLSNLQSIVGLELHEAQGGDDKWQPLLKYGEQKLAAFELTENGRGRFLRHLRRLKTIYSFPGSFTVRSGNNFPSDCGLASSASSFAALTKVALQALGEITGKKALPVHEASELSRQGSGSSCRSFFAPWSIWNVDGAAELDLGYADLIHQVIVVDDEKKAISSSEAHLRVTSSLLFRGRPDRAEQRSQELIKALREKNWRAAFEITWAEFWDMHALFETSVPSFGYMNEKSLAVLRWVQRNSWEKNGDGPLVTMDAGPNIHLLHRSGSPFVDEVVAHFSAEAKADRIHCKVFTGGQS